MAFTKVVGAGIHTLSNITSHNINSSGIITATKFVGPMENGSGISTFYDLRVTNNLTVEGTTTTLDTKLVEVDKIEVEADSTNVAIAVTHTGSGDILRLYDGASQVVTVDDEGQVGIGTSVPSTQLQIVGSTASVDSTGGTLGIRQKGDSKSDGITLTSSHANSARFWKDSDGALHIYNTGGNVGDFVLTNAGRVGIGTSIPGEKLSVEDSSPAVLINATSGSGESKLQFGRTGNTNVGEIKYEHSNNALTFRTNDGADRLRIDSSGLVGIGTVNPTSLLTVGARPKVTSAAATVLISPASGNASIQLRGGSPTFEFDGTSGGNGRIFTDSADLAISSGTLDNAGTELVRIKSSTGAVGIGTNAYGNIDPLAPLHVSSYSATTTITTFNHLRDASQILCQTSNNVNDSRSGITFTGALHSTDGCSAGIIANHENVAENSETTSLSFYTSHNETLGERLRISSDGRLLAGVDTSQQGDANLQVFRNSSTSRITFGCISTSSSGIAGIDFCPSNKVMGSRIECQAQEDFSEVAKRSADLVFITRRDGTFDERMRINSYGQVGINTSVGGQLAIAMDSSNTNPLATGFIALTLKNTNTTDNTSVCMDFNNSAGGIVGRFGAQFKDTSDKDTDLYFATRADSGSLAEALRIDKDGRVLIGYTASVAKHQTSANVQISGTTVNDASASLGIWGASADPARLEFSKSRHATIGSHTAVAADDTLGEINFSGSDGTRYLGSAYIKATATTPIADYDVAGFLSFGTNYGTTSPSERVRITKDGYVHIGTASHLGTMRVGGQAITGQDQDPIIKVYTSSSNQWLAQLRSDHTTGNGVFLRAGNSSSTYTLYACGYDEKNANLIVRGDGKVGIQTSSLSDVFEVHALGNNSDNRQQASFERKTSANNKQAFGLVIRSNAQNSSGNEPTAYLRFDARPSSLNGSHGGNAIIAFSPIGVTQGTYGKGNLDFYLRSGGTYTFLNDPGGAGEMQPKLRIDPDGRVLIGTTDTLHSSGHNLIVGSGSGEEGMSIYSGSTSAGVINFADSNSGDGRYDGRILYNHGTNPYMRFHVGGGTERFRIYERQTYGVDNYAQTGTGAINASQDYPLGTFEWNNDTDSGIEKYNCYIQATGANETDMYITVRNSSFYRITIKASHNSTQADVAMYLVYGLNSQVVGNKIVAVVNSGQFTVTNHNTHVNTYSSTIKISYGTSCNQGLRALVETIGGF